MTSPTASLRPLLLAADNFTPPHRTPWGGRRILERYKPFLRVGRDPIVGESWEISAGKELPSRVEPDGRALPELIAEDPFRMLGPAAAARGGASLLVKLLDAGDDLSVQIHPDDHYPGLAADESGKPESWYVLEADEGAGLYLGLREGVTREAMREALTREADVSELLHFTEVSSGDFFLIEAGTAHAIGRGVTLVEPQRVAPGKRGVTYRYWDWNRRYDEKGAVDPAGAARELHVEHALAVTNWSAPRGDALLASIRVRGGAPDGAGPVSFLPLAGEGTSRPSEHLRVARLAGTGSWTLEPEPTLRGLTVVEGRITLRGDDYALEVDRGRSVVLPAGLPALKIDLRGAHAVLASAP